MSSCVRKKADSRCPVTQHEQQLEKLASCILEKAPTLVWKRHPSELVAGWRVGSAIGPNWGGGILKIFFFFTWLRVILRTHTLAIAPGDRNSHD